MNTYIGFRMDGGFVDENEKSMDRTELIKRIIAIKEQNRKLKAALLFYANKDSWVMGEFGSYICKKDLTQEVEMDYVDVYGGKLAREIIKETKCNTID
jgi:hypothetical protein